MARVKLEKIDDYYKVINLPISETNEFETLEELKNRLEQSLIKEVGTIKIARERGLKLKDLLDEVKGMINVEGD